MNGYDVIVVGGGLAGLTAAVHLASEDYNILVLEKQPYPHHKVCGEYVSNEVNAYLDHLGISLAQNKAIAIDTLQLSTRKGHMLYTKLPLGGRGISRFTFDNLLYQKALANKVSFVFETVTDISFNEEMFTITTKAGNSFKSPIAIGAYGKRSQLDKKMERRFTQVKSSWLAVKAHYRYNDFPENVVALHNFRGGYAGLSKTETQAVNFCYLASYKSFKPSGNIDQFNEKVVSQNPFLASFLKNAEPIFAQPLSIAQVSFYPKRIIEHHVLMCGDTAGLIHPLCGNGMAIAIHSAKILAEHIIMFLKTPSYGRGQLERDYQRVWNSTFRARLRTGRQLQALLLNNGLSSLAMGSVAKSPWLLDRLIRKTHGKPIMFQ
ncbi:NAD(P)/FAD-dependent oxidoreductase [Spongiimicrobium sp. 3-5]|uniref:NAD(P)/FAD-dependent oxidoreductase n=1 Tax=Spongiimicrobium sp. 3-5 TaxID=3332596 RepID=UPI003980D884